MFEQENTIDYSPITKLLKRGITASSADQKTFNQYSRGEISLETCKDNFFYNNSIKKERETITDELFIKWLATLGYPRRN